MAAAVPHPLSDLSIAETNRARDFILSLHPKTVIDFRAIYLLEPPKADVIPFLELEHAGGLTAETPRPPRLAQARYDVIGGSKVPEHHESVIDLVTLSRVEHRILDAGKHASLAM